MGEFSKYKPTWVASAVALLCSGLMLLSPTHIRSGPTSNCAGSSFRSAFMHLLYLIISTSSTSSSKFAIYVVHDLETKDGITSQTLPFLLVSIKSSLSHSGHGSEISPLPGAASESFRFVGILVGCRELCLTCAFQKEQGWLWGWGFSSTLEPWVRPSAPRGKKNRKNKCQSFDLAFTKVFVCLWFSAERTAVKTPQSHS